MSEVQMQWFVYFRVRGLTLTGAAEKAKVFAAHFGQIEVGQW